MHRIRIYLVLLALALPGAAAGQLTAASWIMIDTISQTLMVVQGDRIAQVFENISVGRNGPADYRTAGDGRTPLGLFHIAWVNTNSRFHLFFGLDYPNHEHAEQAFRQKLIDFDTYYAIRHALFQGEVPPQNTRLGGYIGIHGIGNGDGRIHKVANWTEGCVALTNEQIEQLAHWVTLGTRVVIY